jgi:branched-chain amino acid transport system substrate-binding protein
VRFEMLRCLARQGAFLATIVVLGVAVTNAALVAQTAPITIDAILPMTGQAAFSGLAGSQTLAAFERYTNANGGVRGTPIHFEIHDDQSSPQEALQLANSAIARHVSVILGPAVTATCAAVGPAVESQGPVQYCFSPGYSPPKNSYAFASTSTIRTSTEALLLYAKLRGFHRVAFLGSTDATGIAVAAINSELFSSPKLAGLELVANERLGSSELTAAAQMTNIKAARPDVLWTSATGTTFVTAMRSMHDAGLDIPVITTAGNANEEQLKSVNEYLPSTIYFNGFPFQLGSALKDQQLQAQGKIFVDAFKMVGVHPTAVHALSWDSLLLVLAAYRQYGSTITADQLRSYILSRHHFVGLNGTYDFSSGDQHGLGPDSVVVIGWDRSKGSFYPASQPGGLPLTLSKGAN